MYDFLLAFFELVLILHKADILLVLYSLSIFFNSINNNCRIFFIIINIKFDNYKHYDYDTLKFKGSTFMFQGLRVKLAEKLQAVLQKHIENRPPDFTIGKDYLRRWWIIPRNPYFNIYYHLFRISDDDRAMHDHMYFNLSFLLEGSYTEHTVKGSFPRTAGDFKIRFPTTLHRIAIPKDKTCWTLFITAPRIRNWGFQIGPIVKNWFGFKTKSGWLDHESYIAKYGEQLNN